MIEANPAAGIAATGLAGSALSEIVTRVTRIELRQKDSRQRLRPPDGGA